MATSTSSITRFHPNLLTDPRLNYAKFINAVWHEAVHTCKQETGNNYGLLNFITTDAQWNALPGNRIVDAITLAVTFAPRYDIVNDVVQPALTVSANAFKVYEKLQSNQQEIRKALSLLTLKIAASVPAVDIAALRDPLCGEIFITAEQYLHRVSLYKELTTEDIHQLDQRLRQPKKGGEDLTVIIERHLDCHSIRAVAGQPLNEFDKVQCLSEAISADPACAAATLSFRQSNPIPRNQTFADLADHVTVHAPNHVPTIANIGLSPAFSAAGAFSQQEILSLRNQLSVALAASSSSATTPSQANSTKPISSSSSNSNRKKYCYYHGYGHAGTKCRIMLASPVVFSPAKLHATDPNSVPGGKN
jgi:hypothetical protein